MALRTSSGLISLRSANAAASHAARARSWRVRGKPPLAPVNNSAAGGGNTVGLRPTARRDVWRYWVNCALGQGFRRKWPPSLENKARWWRRRKEDSR